MNISDIIKEIGGGDIINEQPGLKFTDIKTWPEAGPNDIVFSFKNNDASEPTNAGLLISSAKQNAFKATQIIHQQPRKAMAILLELFYPYKKQVQQLISDQASISESAMLEPPVEISPFSMIGDQTKIEKGTYIGANVTIGKNCRIGKHCIIYPQVAIYDNTVIGDHSVIHSGAVIGADGFGYEKDNKEWRKLSHKGKVVIGNNVEIGASTTIDRGCLSDTVISDGVKIDNQVQIAHNVTIGAHTVIAGGALVSGSVTIGSQCIIAGSTSFKDNISIGDSVTVLAQSGVTKSIKSNQVVSGYPAQPHRKELSFQASLRKNWKT